jgi:hypothetical protein
MEALASLGYDRAGKIPAALLNWILHFSPNDENHVHQMVSMNSDATTGGAGILHFYCYACCNKYALKVLKPRPGIMRNDFTCTEEPVHHLHTYITSDKLTGLSKTVIEIRCCSCDYHAILLCQPPPIPKDSITAFFTSLKSKKLATNTLKALYELLDEVSLGKVSEVNLNSTKIINICQNEHGM